MARNQARSNKLVRSEDGTFGTMWGYNMDMQPIEMCLQPRFFDSCRGNLMAGDQLRVTEVRNKTVTKTCTLIVLRKDDTSVHVQLYEGKPIYKYELPESFDMPKSTAENDFGEREEYIKGTAQIEKKLDGNYEIITDQGVVATAESMNEALAKRRGDIPL